MSRPAGRVCLHAAPRASAIALCMGSPAQRRWPHPRDGGRLHAWIKLYAGAWCQEADHGARQHDRQRPPAAILRRHTASRLQLPASCLAAAAARGLGYDACVQRGRWLAGRLCLAGACGAVFGGGAGSCWGRHRRWQLCLARGWARIAKELLEAGGQVEATCCSSGDRECSVRGLP